MYTPDVLFHAEQETNNSVDFLYDRKTFKDTGTGTNAFYEEDKQKKIISYRSNRCLHQIKDYKSCPLEVSNETEGYFRSYSYYGLFFN